MMVFPFCFDHFAGQTADHIYYTLLLGLFSSILVNFNVLALYDRSVIAPQKP